MTPEQAEILQEVHDSNIRMEERFKHFEKTQADQNASIIELAKYHFKLERKVDADRNKVFGAIWVFATGFITMIIGFIISLFYNTK